MFECRQRRLADGFNFFVFKKLLDNCFRSTDAKAKRATGISVHYR
jgi:hypothetical protein